VQGVIASHVLPLPAAVGFHQSAALCRHLGKEVIALGTTSRC